MSTTLDAKARRANGSAFGVLIFGLLGTLMSLALAFAIPPSARWIALAAVAANAVLGVYLYRMRMREDRYTFLDYYLALIYGAWQPVLIFTINGLSWLHLSVSDAIAILAISAGLFAVGYVVGIARLDKQQQGMELSRFIKEHPDGYTLARRHPDWAAYSRRFKSRILEALFKLSIWMFALVCLVFAALGGGAAPAVLFFLDMTDGAVGVHQVALFFLSVPVFLALGYGCAALLPAALSWRALTRGRGSEHWPDV